MNANMSCLDILFEEFNEKIFYIQSSQNFIKEISHKASENSRIQYEKEKVWEVEIHSSTTHVMVCKDLGNGGITKIGSKEFSIDEYSRIYEKIRNRQYQWLLVEAYEVYENYLKKLYANIGYLDPDFWRTKDFGSISLSEINNNDLNWFIERVTKGRGIDPTDILIQINKKIPLFEKILSVRERDDPRPRKTEYKRMMHLIEKLRHIIVHCNGITDKLNFIEKFSTENGIHGRDKRQEYHEIINYYFGAKELSDTVCLIEISNPINKITHYDRLNDLIEIIAEYTTLIHRMTTQYLERKTNESNS